MFERTAQNALRDMRDQRNQYPYKERIVLKQLGTHIPCVLKQRNLVSLLLDFMPLLSGRM